MNIRKAVHEDFDVVRSITQETIAAKYPHYYPKGTVKFFSEHHSDEKIERDIKNGNVYILEENQEFAGTVTVNGTEINRLFVLPQFQKKGFGAELLKFAEGVVSKYSVVAALHSSLPAKSFYLKRGYSIIESRTAEVCDGDFLCVDIMAKYFG